MLALVWAASACGLTPDNDVMAEAPIALAQVGQGVMVNLHGAGTFAIANRQRWRFDEAAAGAYFRNLPSGAPALACLGSACAGDVCGTPLPPPAPTPDPSRKVINPGHTSVVESSRCMLLDGGILTATDSYTQSVQVPVSCNVLVNNQQQPRSATYTFVFPYFVAPLFRFPMAPFSAWTLIDGDGEGGGGGGDHVHVSISAEVASESVTVKGATRRYSFGLQDGGVNRVQNLALLVDGVVSAPGSSLLSPVDFTYVTNAASTGHAELLLDASARAILNTDDFAGNDDGGADGSALAKAVTEPVGADLGPGHHTVTLTGTVKGNSAAADVSFSVQQMIHVITPGCATP